MLEHRIAKLTAGASFILLVIGGMVNPTGSSLACPEPTMVCKGQLFPPMVGGVFYEHGHRLAAMTVGLLQIALTILLALRKSPKQPAPYALLGLQLVGVIGLGYAFKIAALAPAVLGSAALFFLALVVVAQVQQRPFVALALGLLDLVIVQGTLGALTVKFKLPWYVSTAHLLVGMTYFTMLVYTAFRTRAEPAAEQLAEHAARCAALGRTRIWIAVACGAVVVQIALGALVRHLGAAMVCLGIPSCTRGGDWWPNAGVQQLHMIHRAVGVAVGIVTTIAAGQIYLVSRRITRRRAEDRGWPVLHRIAVVAPVVVLAQIALGVATVLTLRGVPLAVGHFAGAMTLWALWISAWLITGPRQRMAAVGEVPQPTLRPAVTA